MAWGIIDETRYAPFEALGTHYHIGPTLSLVFRGGYRERFAGGELKAGPLTAVLKPARFAHANEMSPAGLHALYVEPTAELLDEACPELARRQEPVALLDARVAALVALVFRDVRDGERVDAPGVQAYLFELLSEAEPRLRVIRIPHRPGRASWLERVRERLHAELREGPRIRALADDVGVHPVHLVQAFRRRYGCTVGEYVRRQRVEYVAARLRGRDPVGRIALDAGFADHSHMTRVFRRVVGVTPTAYRALVAAGRAAPPGPPETGTPSCVLGRSAGGAERTARGGRRDGGRRASRRAPPVTSGAVASKSGSDRVRRRIPATATTAAPAGRRNTDLIFSR